MWASQLKAWQARKASVCVAVRRPLCSTQRVRVVMNDCGFRGARCMEFNRWLISPCTRGMTVRRLSVCFPSPSLPTGNFHVVNGGIDPGSILFVLGSVYHRGRKQEWELSQVWLHSVGGMWSMASTWHAGYLLHLCDLIGIVFFSIDSLSKGMYLLLFFRTFKVFSFIF